MVTAWGCLAGGNVMLHLADPRCSSIWLDSFVTPGRIQVILTTKTCSTNIFLFLWAFNTQKVNQSCQTNVCHWACCFGLASSSRGQQWPSHQPRGDFPCQTHRGSSVHCGWDVKRGSLAMSLKVRQSYCRSQTLHIEVYPQENENAAPQEPVCEYLWQIIHYHPKVETIQMSTNWSMDK